MVDGIIPSVGIVYSTDQRRVRRILVVDDHIELPMPVVAGETYLEVSLVDYKTFGAEVLVQIETGLSPLSDRCAVVDRPTKAVLRHVLMDPAVDTVTDGNLVQSDLSRVGDEYVGKKFYRDFAIINDVGKVLDIIRSKIDPPPTPGVGERVVDAGNLIIGETDTALRIAEDEG